MAGRKMAKSAGNFQRVTELAERGLDPLAFRYLALTVALRPQARLLGRLDRRGRGGPRVPARRAWPALGPPPDGRPVAGATRRWPSTPPATDRPASTERTGDRGTGPRACR